MSVDETPGNASVRVGRQVQGGTRRLARDNPPLRNISGTPAGPRDRGGEQRMPRHWRTRKGVAASILPTHKP